MDLILILCAIVLVVLLVIATAGLMEPSAVSAVLSIKPAARTEKTARILNQKGSAPPADVGGDGLKERQLVKECVERLFTAVPGGQEGEPRSGLFEDINSAVRERIAEGIRQIRPFTGTGQIARLLQEPKVELSGVSALFVKDPILSGRILKVANSPAFNLGHRIESVSQALLLLGLANVLNIMYHDNLFRHLLRGNGLGSAYDPVSLYEHSIVTSHCAMALSASFDGLDKGALFTVGLLLDIGKFILSREGKHLTEAPLPGTAGRPLSVVEEEKIFGINHSLVGAQTA